QVAASVLRHRSAGAATALRCCSKCPLLGIKRTWQLAPITDFIGSLGGDKGRGLPVGHRVRSMRCGFVLPLNLMNSTRFVSLTYSRAILPEELPLAAPRKSRKK